MLKPRILVTGATGKTGSVVVAELLKAGYRVCAMVHREDRRSARLKAQGAEIAVAHAERGALNAELRTQRA
jgi:NAD(P)H dehydrogenase (quinone)